MNRSIITRIVIDILIFFFIINGWWFIAVPLIGIGAWKFSFIPEIVIAGVMYDALFGMTSSYGVWGYVGTIVAAVIICIAQVIKKMIR